MELGELTPLSPLILALLDGNYSTVTSNCGKVTKRPALGRELLSVTIVPISMEFWFMT
jgi:hypothetical protein